MEVQYVSSGYVTPGYYQVGLSIDWETRVIFVPKFFLTLLSGTTYTLDTNLFRNALKDIEDSPIGIVHPDTHKHNTQVLLGGITYARVIEMINGYTITFEDGRYSVNLVGSNNNIADVTNLNQVSVRTNNSAGLQVFTQSVGGIGTVAEVANAVWDATQAAHTISGSMGAAMSAAGTAGDPWIADLSTYTVAGSAGKVLKDAGVDVTTIKANTDTVEASLSTLATMVDAVPTAAENATAVWNHSIRELSTSMTPQQFWDFLLSTPMAAGSAGEKLKKVLTFSQFIGLK